MDSSLSPSWMQYQQYLDLECLKTVQAGSSTSPRSTSLCVGIVGGGMAGLYSALLLQQHIPGVKVKIFEANARVGGRVHTHKFSPEPYQYFDAGAMRIPAVDSHKPVFTLIDHLNKLFPDDPITMSEFINSCPEGNRLFYNNTKQNDGRIMSVKYASNHCSELGFPEEANIADHDNAAKLLHDALTPVLNAYFKGALKMFSNISLHDYLSKELGWNAAKLQYIEALTGPTNFVRRPLIDQLFYLRIFEDVPSWKTIDGGMSKLPELCAKALLTKDISIVLNSKIEAIIQVNDQSSIQLGYRVDCKDLVHESFDAVIMAIPPPHIRTIPERPHWGQGLEQALRITCIAPATTMGLRFNTRFWERSNLQLPASQGGRSVTDLPIRQVVYPSHGIGDGGKGVLSIYTLGDDAEQFNLLSKVEKIKLALQNLQILYPEVNIKEEYAGGDEQSESFLQEAYVRDWSIGALFYHPEEFLSVYHNLVSPQGNVYFAGSHLTPHPVWIVGALESAKRAVQQLVLKQFGPETVFYI